MATEGSNSQPISHVGDLVRAGTPRLDLRCQRAGGLPSGDQSSVAMMQPADLRDRAYRPVSRASSGTARG